MTSVLRIGLSLMLLACAAGFVRADSVADAEMLAARPLNELPVADRVLVRKGERRLYLMHGENVLRSYRIALGLNPVGHKERAGDFRTPEGRYRLIRRNPRSDFFL